MPKQGIQFDYDLRANRELKETDICLVCEEVLRCRWTDLNGEGVCLKCGTPYQLINGTDEQRKEGNYPYLNLKDEWLLICREYWQERHRFVFGGCSFEERTGLDEFWQWLKQKHPEMLQQE